MLQDHKQRSTATEQDGSARAVIRTHGWPNSRSNGRIRARSGVTGAWSNLTDLTFIDERGESGYAEGRGRESSPAVSRQANAAELET